MKIYAVKSNTQTAFKAEPTKKPVDESTEKSAQKPVYDKNPIKKSGERSNTILATSIAGVIFGGRALAAIMDDGDGANFVFEFCAKIARKIRNRNNPTTQMKPPTNVAEAIQQLERVGLTKKKQSFLGDLGGAIAVMAGLVGVLAIIYTLYNTPKALYDAKVNTVKKGKEMDVYIKGNAVEKELYNQMNDKAKDATPEEKEKLNLQYAKLKAAKNVVPDFVKLNLPTK